MVPWPLDAMLDVIVILHLGATSRYIADLAQIAFRLL